MSRPVSPLSLLILAGVVALAPACAESRHHAAPAAVKEKRAEGIAARPAAPAEVPAAPEKPVGPAPASLRTGSDLSNAIGSGAEALENARRLGPDAVMYYQHLAVLADPKLEGRSADVPGNAIAAKYIEEQLRALGLQPAFTAEDSARTYQQAFKVRGEVDIQRSEASYAWREGLAEAAMPEVVTLKPGEDFNVLGCSGSGEVTGPLAFVGYSVEDGPDGYSSYAKEDDLTGKVALVLRFEPMTPEGKSKWTSFGRWSQRAELAAKVRAAASRGAAAVILANPPGADDPRVESLETARTTRFGGVKVPVVMMSIPAVNDLLARADPQKRTLLRLRQAADEKGGIEVFPSNVSVTLAAQVETRQLPTSNVGAVLPGRGTLAGEYVIIGAHYDHIGLGYVGGANPSNVGQVHPGADDNASGTCGLILAAKLLRDAYASIPASSPARSVLFLAFSGEEMGLLGSDHYVKNPSVTASSIMCMLNMDMIGRQTDNKLEIDGVGTAEGFETIIKPALDRAGFTYTLGQSGRGPSDHASFYSSDIPVLHLFTGLHPDYHRPTDTIEKVNVGGAVKVSALMADLALTLARHEPRLTFKATRGGTMGGRGRSNVRLGIAPGDYSGSTPGVLVGEVFEGTSAANAGIRKGDRMIRWGGEELPDVEAMMSHLAKHKPGDKVDIVIVREGQEITVTVTLIGREPRG